MADREIGFVELTATTRIIFAVGSWKGQSRGSIRKFVASEKYAGPTKSGMSLDGATVAQLLAALRVLQSTVPTKDQNQHVSVGKTRDWEIRITPSSAATPSCVCPRRCSKYSVPSLATRNTAASFGRNSSATWKRAPTTAHWPST